MRTVADAVLAGNAERSTSLSDLLLSSGQTALVSVAASLLLARLTFDFVRRKELTTKLDNKKAELEQTMRNELAVERSRREMDREGHVRTLLHAAAGPLFVVTDELIARLNNIIHDTGYLQLDRDWTASGPMNWTSTHEYFMSSTLYVFGRYFAQEVLLHDRLGSDEPSARRKPLLDGIYEVSTALSSHPAPHNTAGCTEPDVQVFFDSSGRSGRSWSPATNPAHAS